MPRDLVRLINPSLPNLNQVQSYFELSENSSWYSNFGPCYALFTSRISSYFKNQNVELFSNATIAIELLLKTHRKLENNDSKFYVITPSYTFAATTLAILNAGFRPLFVDVDLDDWHASAESIKNVILKYKDKIAALLLCSTFGTLPKKDKLKDWQSLAQSLGAPLFIDSAAGFGANIGVDYDETDFADVVIYSMHATKPFAVGEGGILIGSELYLSECKKLSNFGFDNERNFENFGTNGKISEIMCAFGLAALDNLNSQINSRRAIATQYISKLEKYSDFKFQKGYENATWQSFFVQVDNQAKLNTIICELESQHIQYRRDWSKPTHLNNLFNCEDNLENTIYLAERCLTLPLWVNMDNNQIDFIIENII